MRFDVIIGVPLLLATINFVLTKGNVFAKNHWATFTHLKVVEKQLRKNKTRWKDDTTSNILKNRKISKKKKQKKHAKNTKKRISTEFQLLKQSNKEVILN